MGALEAKVERLSIKERDNPDGEAKAVVDMPLFPLRTVLFPGGVLPLRVFEPRYVDMVSACMRRGEGFGVVLIRSGVEARASSSDSQPEVFTVGTEATIVDFNQTDEGLLGLVTRGGRKFVIHETYEQADHLLMGRVTFAEEEPLGELGTEHETLVAMLRELCEHPLIKKLSIEVNFEEARSVSLRLADLLPIEPEIKQSLLQLRWPRERLAELKRIVGKFQQ